MVRCINIVGNAAPATGAVYETVLRMKNALSVSRVPNVEEVAAEYLQLKAVAAELEAEMKGLRGVLEAAVGECPDRTAELAGVTFTLVDVERENFNLKKAVEKLGRRALRSFITASRYTQLRVRE